MSPTYPGSDPRHISRRRPLATGRKRRPASTRSSLRGQTRRRWTVSNRTCLSAWRTTSISTRRRSTRRTSARSSGPARSRCFRTGATCRSATTAAPARSSSAAPTCVRPVRQRTPGHDGDAPPFGPTHDARHRAARSASSSAPASAIGELECRSPTRADHVFGVVLAQRLERARHPGVGVRSRSGPFLGKSFATSRSRAWVVPLAALRDRVSSRPPAGARAGSTTCGHPSRGPRHRPRRSSSTATMISRTNCAAPVLERRRSRSPT